MDAASLKVQIASMIQENPIELTCNGETHDAGVANIKASERQATIGNLKAYKRSVWIMVDDWTNLPAKRDVVTLESIEYRVLVFQDYYMDTARRLDLGDKYELGRGGD